MIRSAAPTDPRTTMTTAPLPLFTDEYFIFDYETGGFAGTREGRPVELALLYYGQGRVELSHRLINPELDDPTYQQRPEAIAVHGLTPAVLREKGVHPGQADAFLRGAFARNPNSPIWAHCGTSLDFPVAEAEARRFGLQPPWIDDSRLRDSGGIYKGLLIGLKPSEYQSWLHYCRAALAIPRRGLFFSVSHLVSTLDVGVKLIGDPKHPTGFDLSVDLGVAPELARELSALGMHRAAFDCVATHGIVNHLRQNTDQDWIDSLGTACRPAPKPLELI